MKASLPYSYITAVKNGKHYVVFDFKDENGKRKRKWKNTELPEKCSKKALKEAVDAIINEFEKDISEGAVLVHDKCKPLAVLATPDVSNQSLTDFFSEWLANIKPNSARTTHQVYRGVVTHFQMFMNEKYPDVTLGTITHTHIQSYINYKLDSGCLGNTVKQYYLALHSAFSYAVRMEKIEAHPMDKLVLPRAERHEAAFYNADELNGLFDVFKGDKIELIVHIAAYYGLRRSEVLGLRWDAIDFQNKTLSVQRKVVVEYDDDGNWQLFVETRLKTNSTRRTLPLIPHIEEMLLEKKKAEEQFRKACGKSYNKEYEGFVCRDNYGNLISPNYVTGRFGYMVKKHGLRHLRFHDLRHSCASLLLANDVPMKAIQEWLGHSNFTITANLYSHLEYNAKVNSAETIARVLGAKADNQSETSNPACMNSEPHSAKPKTTKNTPSKKTGGRKKKGDFSDGSGESPISKK